MNTLPTNQQFFDNALFGIRKQNAFAKVKCGFDNQQIECVYWDKETNRKCGIGQSIPEEKYQEEFDSGECKLETVLNESFNTEFKGYQTDNSDDILFYKILQRIHDGSTNMEEFEEKMKDFAITHNLIYTPKPDYSHYIQTGKL